MVQTHRIAVAIALGSAVLIGILQLGGDWAAHARRQIKVDSDCC